MNDIQLSDLAEIVTKGKDLYGSYEEAIDENSPACGLLSNMSDDHLAYIEEALDNGCLLGLSQSPYDSSVTLYLDTVDWNGDSVVFSQSVYNDPTDNTFMDIMDADGNVRQGNRCAQCAGINLWDIDELLSASYICPDCGCAIDSQSDFHFVIYASLFCEDCAAKEQAYVDSKPSGYWTS